MQCHALGERPATAVFEQAGVNFAYTRDRIRHGFFSRWVLAPLRVDPETKMPKFADEEGKTPLTEYFGGRARRTVRRDLAISPVVWKIVE